MSTSNRIYRAETRSTSPVPLKTTMVIAAANAPDTSWWLGLTREEFSAEAARQQDRMLGQKTSYARGDVR